VGYCGDYHGTRDTFGHPPEIFFPAATRLFGHN